MGNTFTASDWEFVRTRATATAAQVRAKGATVWDFAPLPPIPHSQLDNFTRETGFTLPADLAELVTRFAGGWKFYWCLHVKTMDKFLIPPVDMGQFGGNGDVPFIGATADETLLDRYRSFQSDIRKYLDDPETLKVIPSLFPLHRWDGGGGDYTVLRLDMSPARVYYLDHELMWPVDAEHVIGVGLREFVLGWAHLAFPSCDSHDCWVNPLTREPDANSSKADMWRKWIADANAV